MAFIPGPSPSMNIEKDIHALVLALVPEARRSKGETSERREVRKEVSSRLERIATSTYHRDIPSEPKDVFVTSEAVKNKLQRFPDSAERIARYNNLLLRLQQTPHNPLPVNKLLEVLNELGWTSSPLSPLRRSGTGTTREMPRIQTSSGKRSRSPPTNSAPRTSSLGFPGNNLTHPPIHLSLGRSSPSQAYSSRHRVLSGRSTGSGPSSAATLASAPVAAPATPAERVRAWREKVARPVVPERTLIRDVLFLLGGINGTHVKLEEVVSLLPPPVIGSSASPEPEKLTQVVFVEDGHRVIPEPTRQMIHRISELGRLYKHVSSFVEQRSQDNNTGLAMQALCAFVADELTNYYRLVAVLESQLNDLEQRNPADEEGRKNAAAGSSTKLTLQRVAIWTEDTLLRMRLLSTILEACKDTKGGALASTIHSYSVNGDPLIQSLTESLLDHVSRPLFGMLAKWIFEGELHDPFQEFFVKENEDYKSLALSETTPGVVDEGLAVYDAASFWQHRFSMRDDMRPSFISAQFGQKIFATGKSLNFVRYACGSSEWISSQSFSKKKDHVLSYSDLEGLEQTVDKAHGIVSKHLGEIFLEKLQLVQHLRALQDYLMLGKGDFIELLRTQLQEHLNQPSHLLQRHNVTMALESAIRRSSAQYDSPDITRRLDAKILEESAGDVGWDVFTLEYKVESPVNTILDGPAMQAYQVIFGHLWRMKRTEIAVSEAWRTLTAASTVIRDLEARHPPASALRTLADVALLKLGEMNHMIRQLQSYIQLECCAHSWEDLMGTLRDSADLDELIGLHRHYLDGLIAKVLLRTSSRRTGDPDFLANEVRGTTQIICSYADLCLQVANMAYNSSASHAAQAAPGLASVAPFDPSSPDFGSLSERLASQSARFRDRLQTVTDGLDKHQNLIVRDLSTRLNFNLFYEVAKPHRKTRDKHISSHTSNKNRE